MILQQETETTHVSNVFKLLLYSQPVELGLLVERLTSGVGVTLLTFLQMLLTFTLKFCQCLIEPTSSLVFQCVACDTFHLIQERNLVRRPSLLCLISETTHYLPRFHSGHFGSFCNCNMNFLTSCFLVLSSCPFEGLLVGSSKRFLPVNMLLSQYFPVL